jgi:hypothetical protein
MALDVAPMMMAIFRLESLNSNGRRRTPVIFRVYSRLLAGSFSLTKNLPESHSYPGSPNLFQAVSNSSVCLRIGDLFGAESAHPELTLALGLGWQGGQTDILGNEALRYAQCRSDLLAFRFRPNTSFILHILILGITRCFQKIRSAPDKLLHE